MVVFPFLLAAHKGLTIQNKPDVFFYLLPAFSINTQDF